MSRLIGRALQETAPLWPDIKRAFGWVHRAAHILNNTEALPAPTVARRLDGLCGALCRHRACAGDLADGVDHFLKVTRSYRPGLFHCHAVADLPGTNNGLEGLFGSYRYCQRRTTGRRSASSAVRDLQAEPRFVHGEDPLHRQPGHRGRQLIFSRTAKLTWRRHIELPACANKLPDLV